MFVVSICEKCARNILELVVFLHIPSLNNMCALTPLFINSSLMLQVQHFSPSVQQEGALQKAVVGGNNLEW